MDLDELRRQLGNTQEEGLAEDITHAAWLSLNAEHATVVMPDGQRGWCPTCHVASPCRIAWVVYALGMTKGWYPSSAK